jgi:mRNA-degrading endonuclease YafQ of YafQ-DinJ toxin-antitoxin module
MKIIRTEVSSRFKKSFKKLPPKIQRKTISRIKLFKENPFDPRLRTHPLSGKEKECWSFWIDYHYRIKFIFVDENEVLSLDSGTHNIYK